MVKFKTLKYKHYRQARALAANEDATEDEHISFVLSMVAEWDFVDTETGVPLPVGVASMDELIIEQMNEVTTLFNQQISLTVPKATAGQSRSTSMPSSPDVSLAADFLSGSLPSSSPDDSK